MAGLFTASGCERKPADHPSGKIAFEDVRRDAGQAVNTAVRFSQQSKDECQQTLEARLSELDAKIARLRETGRDLKGQAEADWDRKLTELETKRKAARAKIAEAGHTSAEAW